MRDVPTIKKRGEDMPEINISPTSDIVTAGIEVADVFPAIARLLDTCAFGGMEDKQRDDVLKVCAALMKRITPDIIDLGFLPDALSVAPEGGR